MLDYFYELFRCACGLSLIIAGWGFFVEPERQRARMAAGLMFIASGILFCLSVVSRQIYIPVFIDNLISNIVMYVLCQSFLELGLFLFGDEILPGLRKRISIIGAIWFLLIWALPALDYAFSFPIIFYGIEDGKGLALFGIISASLIYFGPVATVIVTLTTGRWKPSDLPRKTGTARLLFTFPFCVALTLSFVAVFFALAFQLGYRISHTFLQVLMLSWYFFIRARPEFFLQVRHEIENNHKKRGEFDKGQAGHLAETLDRFVREFKIFRNPDLDLAILAKAANVPPYKMSAYINNYLGKSVSEWINSVRINYVRRLLAERDDMSILDISIDAGYSTKTAFNTQFLKIVGEKPSAYREKHRKK